MWICKQCNTENDDSDPFCIESVAQKCYQCQNHLLTTVAIPVAQLTM